MSKKAQVLGILAVVMALIIWAAYAATSDIFIATANSPTSDDTTAELSSRDLHFTQYTDTIRMSGGADTIDMSYGSDKIDFYGNSNSTETLQFNSGATAHIKWTGSDNNLEIRSSGGGDVIVLLSQ